MAKSKAPQIPRKGPEGFEAFYGGVYGDRWPELRAALLSPVRQVARVNRFADPESLHARSKGFPMADFGGSEALILDEGMRLEPQPDSRGLLDVYVMDAASILAAAALNPQAGDEILDLCAAPGGKSLVLAERVGPSGSLTANEMSDRRRARLKAVLHDYLPGSVMERVRVTGHDGARWCLHETSAFDRILVDAPCSGERHLLVDSEELALWSPARTKNLAVRQYALLASALVVVRPGGRIVYSTCSVSPLENDGVIARLLRKREGEVRCLSPSLEIGEPTEHGWMILPDRTGFGPIYFSVLERA
jgi:5-methylcytosine rRNA methyltransferase NSUN4